MQDVNVIYRWAVRHHEPTYCGDAGKRWTVDVRHLPSGLVEMPDARCPSCLCTPSRTTPMFMHTEWMTFDQ